MAQKLPLIERTAGLKQAMRTKRQAKPDDYSLDPGRTDSAVTRFGFWAAVATAAMTVLSFALALTALPDEVPYPFTEQLISDQWPGDYYWLFPAMVLMVLFVALVAALHEQSRRPVMLHKPTISCG